jgi:SAM-dependent methyltransferase
MMAASAPFAHYTAEPDVLRALDPALLRPFRARLAAAASAAELRALCDDLAATRVLDPACGAGDFLRVALRELQAVEAEARARLGADAPPARVGPQQMLGIDVDPGAVAAARAALGLGGDLAGNVICADALFCAWPAADVIVGNPPFLAKNKMQALLGAAYARRLRQRYPGVPGRADYCVYWFRRAHDALPPGGRAVLVGTNTIRQNDSRRGGLDHITAHGGTILEAVASQPWPREAVVYVSIVSWVKGPAPGPKRILEQPGHRPDGPWRVAVVDHIPPSLSAAPDAGSARVLRAVRAARASWQGQTPGHDGFILDLAEARAVVAAEPHSRAVLFPFLTGEDLLARPDGAPGRFVADLSGLDLDGARAHAALFARIEARVRPAREEAARREGARRAELRASAPRGRANGHHRAFLARFWQLAYPRAELLARLAALPRYIACSRIGRRPIFSFVDAGVRPGDALAVFTLSDAFSFGILQSSLHAAWIRARGSSMKGDPRYTSSTVFDTFPWPDRPSRDDVIRVAACARRILEARRQSAHGRGLRDVYVEVAGAAAHPLAEAHAQLDAAVCAAYGMDEGDDPVRFLLALGAAQAAREDAGERIPAPGPPEGAEDAADLGDVAVVRAPAL